MRNKLLFFSLLVLFASCQKEADLGTPGGSNNTNNNNDNNDYQPTTANSEWKMKSSTLGDYTIRALGTDTTVNGTKYSKLDHSLGGRQYVSKKDGVYRQIAFAPQAGGVVNFIYLKDAAVGTTWTATLGQAEMRYSVAATGIKRTVNGKQYSNVLHIHYDQFAMGMQTASGDQYFAKGVGPIEGVSRMEMLGTQMTVDSTYLVSGIVK